MQSSLHSHLTYLEDTLLELTDSLNRPLPADEDEDLRERIAIVNMAINRYRGAYELESQLRTNNARTILPSAITTRHNTAPASYKKL